MKQKLKSENFKLFLVLIILCVISYTLISLTFPSSFSLFHSSSFLYIFRLSLAYKIKIKRGHGRDEGRWWEWVGRRYLKQKLESEKTLKFISVLCFLFSFCVSIYTHPCTFLLILHFSFLLSPIYSLSISSIKKHI